MYPDQSPWVLTRVISPRIPRNVRLDAPKVGKEDTRKCRDKEYETKRRWLEKSRNLFLKEWEEREEDGGVHQRGAAFKGNFTKADPLRALHALPSFSTSSYYHHHHYYYYLPPHYHYFNTTHLPSTLCCYRVPEVACQRRNEKRVRCLLTKANARWVVLDRAPKPTASPPTYPSFPYVSVPIGLTAVYPYLLLTGKYNPFYFDYFKEQFTISWGWLVGWLPLFGPITNVKGDLKETGRDLIVQEQGEDRKVRSSTGRQPTQTLIWFPK
ncbi:hypothetical protein M0802_004621 [Mischocyttarus mexicanus]|nr:hypothetical protein M0802_004621 [Mischocyttarus mexicanus]